MSGATIFEIFTAHDGRTQGYRHTEAVAKRTCDRINPVGPDGLMRKGAPFHDYLPSPHEGFYVVDMRGFVKAGPFMSAGRPNASRADAELRCMVENQGSDSNSFSVVEHTLD
jgi:hypothetical protein